MRLRPAVALACAFVVAVTTGTSAWATTQVGVSVRIKASAPAVLAGQRITVSGTASASPAGSYVHLQTFRAGAWRFVARDAVDSRGTYSIPFTPATGTHAFRAVRPADRSHRLGTSAVLHLTSYRCDPLPAPTVTTTVWFSRPGGKVVAPATRNLSRLFCAAAPGSTIRVGMFFIYTDRFGEVEQILRSLELVHRYRGVQVHFLLERKSYATAGQAALDRLRRFATVEFCYASCRSAIRDTGILHNKTITISDMTWKPTRDPVLVSSTANWSLGQLRNRWQSTQVIFNDPRLTREFDIRWDSMRVCGVAVTGCAAWRRSLGGVALPAAYALQKQTGVWVDPGLGERPGTPGQGMAVDFTPSPYRVDPVVNSLRAYTCTPAHRTVHIAMFRVSIGRQRVFNALAALKARGCDVRLLIDTPRGSSTQADGLASLRARGLPTGCMTDMHDKFLYLDVVRVDNGKVEQAVWSGSHNYTWASLYYNDESMLKMTLQQATGSAAISVRSTIAAYAAQRNRMQANRVHC